MNANVEYACDKYPGCYALCHTTHKGVTTCKKGSIYRIEDYDPKLTRMGKKAKATEWFHMPLLPHPIHPRETFIGIGGYIRITETEMQFTEVDSKNPFHKLADGTEVCSVKDNSGYEGQMSLETGQRHGEGTRTWANGDTYKGQYQNGKLHGKGILMCANGNTYKGQYQNGKRHGIWTYSCAIGIVQTQYKRGIKTRSDVVIDLSCVDTPILPSPKKKIRLE